MKILLITESYWPNADGGALFERRLAQGLASRGHNVTIWAPGVRARSYTEQDDRTIIFREKSWVFLVNPKYRVSYWPWMSALRHITSLKPDVIHIHNPYLMGLAGLMWAKVKKIPVVATNHFMPENALLNLRGVRWLYKPLHSLIWKYLVWFHNRCDYVTSPTPTATSLLSSHGLRKPLEAISNGIDTDRFQPRPKKIPAKYIPDTGLPLILYLGRVDGEKRLDLIIRAMPLILKQVKTHLVVAGFGVAQNSLKALASKLHVEESVTFTGFIDEKDKPALYNSSSLFVISSPAELQSIVTLEAMASGLPIVSVDVAALKELCHDGENGFLFRENDFHQLAENVVRILTNPEIAKKFGAQSRQIVEAGHSTEATFKKYEAAYLKAISE